MKTKTEKNQVTGKKTTTHLVMTGMMTALLAVLSQLSIPMPSGVPVTLQTLAVVLCACILGWKLGTLSVLLYLILGAAGLPVFANFGAGLGAVIGPTGGFLIGFLPLAFLTGVGKEKKGLWRLWMAALGLASCHALGILQFSLVMGSGWMEAFLLVSAPYLVKDGISVFLAFVVGGAVSKGLRAANIPNCA